jgi:hypothetical protein
MSFLNKRPITSCSNTNPARIAEAAAILLCVRLSVIWSTAAAESCNVAILGSAKDVMMEK